MISTCEICLPASWLTDERFSPIERLIGAYLFQHPDKIEHRELVREFRVSKNTVTKALDGFVKAGILVRTARVGGWKLSDEYAEVSSPKKRDNSPNKWDSSPNEWDSEPRTKEEREEKRTKREDKEEYYKDISDEMSLSDSYESDPPNDIQDNIPLVNLTLTEGDTDKVKSIRECPYKEILELFNQVCISYPRVRGMGGHRRQLVSGRWSEFPDLDVFRQVFDNAEKSAFLKGQNRRGWAADFDWMIRPSNFQKILEGKYLDKEGAASANKQGGDPFLEYMDRVIRGEV